MHVPGRRHLVVFLVFVGMLVCIGSREVFTMVVTHVLTNYTRTEATSEQFHMKCHKDAGTDEHQDWPQRDIFLSQTFYFIGNIITQLPGGILAARFSPRRVCGVAILISSALTIVLRFALQYHPWSVFLIRAIQGLVEGPTIPSFNGVIVNWAPKSEKSVMITVAYAGAYLSVAVAAACTGLLICRVSWGSALFIYGGVGVLWSIIWLCFVHDTPFSCPGLSARERALFEREGHHTHSGSRAVFSNIPWRSILTSLPVSAIVVAAFCRNWIFSLLITQIPAFYAKVYKMHAAKYGLWSSLPHVFMTVVVICGGFTVDAIIKRRFVSTTVARKAAETIGFGVEAGCMLAIGLILHDLKQEFAITLLCVGVAFSGIAISGYQVNPLDVAPQYCSVVTGIVRLGTIGSVLSTVLASSLDVQTSPGRKKWSDVFIIAGSIHLFGMLYYLIFASGKRQVWDTIGNVEITVPGQTPDSSGYDTEPDVTGPGGMVPDGTTTDDANARVTETDALVTVEDLLTKSLHINMIADTSEELETPSWFMNTI